MKQKITDVIERAREYMRNQSWTVPNLQLLSNDMARAFDDAIAGIVEKRNVFRDLELNRELLKKWRVRARSTLFPIRLRFLISAPFIYGISVPFAVFHVFLELYHQICFRLYGIPLVYSKDYFIYDRQLLPYLNWIEKCNCVYCSYANGLIRYASEIAGRTERYWCPIKHARHVKNAHSQYAEFVDFLDAKDFREKWHALRSFEEEIKSGIDIPENKNPVCKRDI